MRRRRAAGGQARRDPRIRSISARTARRFGSTSSVSPTAASMCSLANAAASGRRTAGNTVSARQFRESLRTRRKRRDEPAPVPFPRTDHPADHPGEFGQFLPVPRHLPRLLVRAPVPRAPLPRPAGVGGLGGLLRTAPRISVEISPVRSRPGAPRPTARRGVGNQGAEPPHEHGDADQGEDREGRLGCEPAQPRGRPAVARRTRGGVPGGTPVTLPKSTGKGARAGECPPCRGTQQSAVAVRRTGPESDDGFPADRPTGGFRRFRRTGRKNRERSRPDGRARQVVVGAPRRLDRPLWIGGVPCPS
ncbi:hypothetical protein LX15_003772 [Streptoalloteichus tenebrarius]|uniref:Uncharacterized protein n=1 Tax=Streptoalloteichus tenebrarius (strain ATCC 17920 / DSM 40477 / JCM 4838 / CBS 697.72 / NBRC 16177 / NCIMB 11028 / NRRL B-12390 / A12253. 1 / ISP 5477) TaxID=1933 RepID=A0ABT1HX35_STRSD|nr:hypothetical protein [Streptoalloteichus tenebrarius]